MAGCLARDVAQDIPPAVIKAEVAGRVRVASGLQVRQDPRCEPAACVPGAVHCIADADDLERVVPAAEHFLLLHSAIISPLAHGLGSEVRST
jgi:hypothetical protein